MPRTIQDGGLVTQDPSDAAAYEFDWDACLADGVTITVSSFTLTQVDGGTSPAVTLDSQSVLAGSRSTLVRVNSNEAPVGARYQVDNKIVTSETPAQTKERSFFLLVEQR